MAVTTTVAGTGLDHPGRDIDMAPVDPSVQQRRGQRGQGTGSGVQGAGGRQIPHRLRGVDPVGQDQGIGRGVTATAGRSGHAFLGVLHLQGPQVTRLTDLPRADEHSRERPRLSQAQRPAGRPGVSG